MTIDRLQAVHALRDMLAEGHRVEWKGGEKIGHNTFTTAWPNYDARLWTGVEAAQELLGSDYEYVEHIERVQARPIRDASRSDLATWFTWLVRGERFCDGLIGSAAESGELLALLRRLDEVLEAEKGR